MEVTSCLFPNDEKIFSKYPEELICFEVIFWNMIVCAQTPSHKPTGMDARSKVVDTTQL